VAYFATVEAPAFLEELLRRGSSRSFKRLTGWDSVEWSASASTTFVIVLIIAARASTRLVRSVRILLALLLPPQGTGLLELVGDLGSLARVMFERDCRVEVLGGASDAKGGSKAALEFELPLSFGLVELSCQSDELSFESVVVSIGLQLKLGKLVVCISLLVGIAVLADEVINELFVGSNPFRVVVL
jgi:hypothetical protein